MDYKSYGAKVHDIDEAKGIVAVYVSAFDNVDADGDITVKGAFSKTISENKGRIRWFKNHDPSEQIGVPLLQGSEENQKGLLSLGQLNLKKEIGRDIFEDYKLNAEHGRTLEHSIGFEILQSEKGEKDGDPVRYIKEYRLWEQSTLMGWGANEQTPMVGMKGLDNTIALLEQQLKMNYSDTRLNQVESILKSLREQKPDDSTSELEPIQLTKLFYESINKK